MSFFWRVMLFSHPAHSARHPQSARSRRQKVGTTPADLRRLAEWLVEQDVAEVVMESTAQYWRPVWEALEQHWRVRRSVVHGDSALLLASEVAFGCLNGDVAE
jgi:hypothetical protein